MGDRDVKEDIMRSEWTYLVDEDEIGNAPVRIDLEPSAGEKAALEKRLGIQSIDSLKAHMELRRTEGGMVVYVRGRLIADLVQKCVVSLEPVAEHIDEEFEAWFSDPNKAVSFAKARRERLSRKDKEEAPVLEEHDDPEPIVDGQINLGELATQYFSLFLNPYPHAEGLPPQDDDDPPEGRGTGEYDNPFAALKDWKARSGRE